MSLKTLKLQIQRECEKKHLDVSDKYKTNLKRLQQLANDKHKKNGVRGRVPSVLKSILRKLLKKKGHEYSVTVSETFLMNRFMSLEKNDDAKNINDAKNIKKEKKQKLAPLIINKAYVSANNLQEVLAIPAGTICSFKNGSKKKLVACSTGGYRYKKLE